MLASTALLPASGTPAALYRGAEPRDMMFIGRTAAGQWATPVSVDGQNWKFSGCPHVGGALVGGASLVAEDFLGIARAAVDPAGRRG